MTKLLTDSHGTGRNIMENINSLELSLINKEEFNDSVFYTFSIVIKNNNKFESQQAEFVIQVKDNRIAQSSTLNCKDFSKTLPIYNDATLKEVANYLLENIK